MTPKCGWPYLVKHARPGLVLLLSCLFVVAYKALLAHRSPPTIEVALVYQLSFISSGEVICFRSHLSGGSSSCLV